MQTTEWQFLLTEGSVMCSLSQPTNRIDQAVVYARNLKANRCLTHVFVQIALPEGFPSSTLNVSDHIQMTAT